jgi:hypothetical protein
MQAIWGPVTGVPTTQAKEAGQSRINRTR